MNISSLKTLADIAEEYMIAQNIMPPPRNSADWVALYENWISYAFAGNK